MLEANHKTRWITHPFDVLYSASYHPLNRLDISHAVSAGLEHPLYETTLLPVHRVLTHAFTHPHPALSEFLAVVRGPDTPVSGES